MNKQIKQISIRSLIIGLTGVILITASSLYAALRMGALPWPTLFAAVLSLSILRSFKNYTLQEVNITHTIMTSGAMVAGGLAFTIPGIWIIDPDYKLSITTILLITLSGALLGSAFTSLQRKTYIVENPLPYPLGQAAAETLIIGEKGGSQAKLLFSVLGISAIFTTLRDKLHIIPQVFSKKLPGLHTPNFDMWISPMAAGIGFIIGPLYTGIWLMGTFIGYFLLVPIGLRSGFFSDIQYATAFRSELGIGLMVGTGFGILCKGVIHIVKNRKKRQFQKIQFDTFAITLLLFSLIPLFLLIVTSKLTIIEVLLLIPGVWLTVSMAAMLTGQTGINPMEILGILVILGMSFIIPVSMPEAFILAGITAIACGLTGDIMNDLKAGHLVGTSYKQQLLGETAGSILGAVIASSVLLLIKEAFGPFGSASLPAPQAAAVASMIKGLQMPEAFFIGVGIAFLAYLYSLPTITLGLGVYLPISISSIVGLGGLMRILLTAGKTPVQKEKREKSGALIASGILGGEGIMGVILAFLSLFS